MTQAELLSKVKARFEANPALSHYSWAEVEGRLLETPGAVEKLAWMEETDGEPAVLAYDDLRDRFEIYDSSLQSPKGRRSLCYDEAALRSRKDHPPRGSAVAEAEKLGLEVLDETQYVRLQALWPVDTKSSSWIRTPEAIRAQGGALFGDYRYGRVFVYYNGAQSYYASRGFRVGFYV